VKVNNFHNVFVETDSEHLFAWNRELE